MQISSGSASEFNNSVPFPSLALEIAHPAYNIPQISK